MPRGDDHRDASYLLIRTEYDIQHIDSPSYTMHDDVIANKSGKKSSKERPGVINMLVRREQDYDMLE
jgi:hypothetical protein